MLSGEINGRVPPGGMQELSLESVQPWDDRPLPRIEHASCIDEEIAIVVDFGTVREIGDLDVPTCFRPIPCCVCYLMA